MNPGDEHGVLTLEFEEEEGQEEEEDETMVKPKRLSEGGGGRFRAALAAVIVSLLLIVGVGVTSKARPAQPALRSAVVDNASDLVSSDNGSRTFEFVLTTLEGLEGKSGTVVIKTMPEWAPLGAKQFHALVDDGFYQNCRFFRVIPNFMVQFGISGDPNVQKKHKKEIKDDPVLESNKRGTMTFATSGANTRTTQLFINTNTKDNDFLDKQGFAPFAQVLSGMEFVDQIFDGYREKPDQGLIQQEGNAYLEKEFPKLSWISAVKEIQ